jgi:hypothetical protein
MKRTLKAQAAERTRLDTRRHQTSSRRSKPPASAYGRGRWVYLYRAVDAFKTQGRVPRAVTLDGILWGELAAA